jgi:hypothetical protein
VTKAARVGVEQRQEVRVVRVGEPRRDGRRRLADGAGTPGDGAST